MAGFFSPATLEQVRAASDIVDVIGACLPLKRAGANFVALCPFHKEKTPSFHVNPQRQIFHCFGCHKGGDVFTFIKEYENITFPEAVKRLADRARIPLEYEQSSGEQQSRHVKDRLLQIHEQMAQRWQNALATEAAGQDARDYLARRGVSGEAIKLFRLGYAPDAWDDTVNWARSRELDLALMEKAGLIVRKEGAEHYYDRFRGRLMFPICDEQGRVIGFSGRILAGDEKTAKYVNSPETPIFTKSKVFFGLDKSKRALLDAGFAVVCEGQLDLIACFMAGVQNVVAPQGTAFTAEQARILKRYVDEVVLCFDSDEAGQNAAVRSLDHLVASGLAVRVAQLPAPHDPDSYIKANGGTAFARLVEEAEGFFDYYLARLCVSNDARTDKGRLAVLRQMSEAVHKTGNAVLIDKYAQKSALRLGVSAESVRAEFRKLRPKPGAPSAAGEAGGETQARNLPSKAEFGLLQLLFQNEELIAWAASCLNLDWIRHALVRKILSERLSLHHANAWPGLAPFLQLLQDPAAQGLLTEAVTQNYMEGAGAGLDKGVRDHLRGRAVPKPFDELKGLLTRLRNDYLEIEIAELTRKLAALEPGAPEQIQVYREKDALNAIRRQPIELPSAER
jgi:DNA primase